MEVRRLRTTLRPDPSRVLIRPFWPVARPRPDDEAPMPYGHRIINRIMALTEEEVLQQWQAICADFGKRHPSIEQYFLERFAQASRWMPADAKLSEARQLLLGTYFTQEYSVEAAALFNPSVVLCPDQSNLPDGALRFVLSLRAVGEGHISSICFRCGVLTPDFEIEFSEHARWVVEPQLDVDESFDRGWFEKKAREIGTESGFLASVIGALPEKFNETQLTAAVHAVCGDTKEPSCIAHGEGLLLLAKSNFSVHFDRQQRFSERSIFPVSPSQINGIEDARFVRFTDDDGTVTYYATYTAYDGRVIYPQFLETMDFLHFHFSTLCGAAVQNKGMALFPRRIRGRYAMLSRQDTENIRIMFSDDLYCWETSELLAAPAQPWEFTKIGNCGSPIELDEGWLVITHGVGAMRKYCLGAILLDRDNPAKVIGRLTAPLIRPEPEDRDGYVPNVVYTCGGLVHRDHLFLPYGTADSFTSFAIVPVADLLAEMK